MVSIYSFSTFFQQQKCKTIVIIGFNRNSDEMVFYTCSPLCALAQAGLLTGRYNHRTCALSVESNRGLDRITSRHILFAMVQTRCGINESLCICLYMDDVAMPIFCRKIPFRVSGELLLWYTLRKI